ncbi:LOW QUALITY PROTEIN: hypothetical protein TorRG33x02_355630 [Trema orientale]|uniref:Uncharacterized protein n=1 Tax=Trema orientale TaxID=63057 RepID=A0A2P5A922_TREOI|nr:LOW QUALITY PROTEIN: hypothetical protein TorRG33x02_355630 [Trema orientale]
MFKGRPRQSENYPVQDKKLCFRTHLASYWNETCSCLTKLHVGRARLVLLIGRRVRARRRAEFVLRFPKHHTCGLRHICALLLRDPMLPIETIFMVRNNTKDTLIFCIKNKILHQST